MKIKQIKAAYANLELIIHRKKYLIPNKPVAPLRPYIKFISQEKTLIKEAKASFSESTSLSGSQLYRHTISQLISNHHPAYTKIEQQFSNEMETYKVRSKEYQEKYLKPATYFKNNPYMYFTSKYWSKFIQEEDLREVASRRLSEKWSEIKVIWNNIELKDKNEKLSQMQEFTRKFFEEYEQIRKKQLRMYQDYVEKHEIPKIRQLRGINEFLSQRSAQLNITNKFESSFFELYNRLPQEQKGIYEENARIKNKLSYEKYEKFLQSWGITHEKLTNIRAICEEYAKINEKSLKDIIRATEKIGGNEDHDDLQQP